MRGELSVKRWIPTLTMMLVSLISYVDRSTLNLLAPTILKETGLSNQEYGYIISAFSFAYMFGNPVWGILIDELGLRKGMTLAVALWTLASTMHAFASGLFSFGLARAVLGFGEGATFPGGLRTAVQTLPLESRSRGIAVSYSGGALGALLTPLIVTPIALTWGWRAAFWFTGCIGLVWLVVWRVVSKRPEIMAPSHRDAPHSAPLEWSDPRTWAFMTGYGLCASPLAFILYNASIYFVQGMGRTQADMGKVLWIPPLGWEAGYYFWGWVTDKLPLDNVRFLSGLRRQMAVLTLLMFPLAAIPWQNSYPLTLAMMFVTMFAGSGFVISTMAYATRVFSSERAGLIAGLGAGSWSLVVAVLAPLFGRMFDQRDYSTAFASAAAVPVLGYLAFLWLSSRTSTASRPS